MSVTRGGLALMVVRVSLFQLALLVIPWIGATTSAAPPATMASSPATTRATTQAATSRPISILAAARDGDVKAVKQFLDDGVGVDSQNVFGRTPLWFAVFADKPEVVKLLISRGANVELRDLEKYAVLFSAARAGKADMIRLLLEQGHADPNVRCRDDWTPLLAAAEQRNEPVTAMLLDAGADVDAVNSLGASALTIAVAHRAATIVDLLLKHHADPNKAEITGHTPLHGAALVGDAKIAATLLAV